MATVARARTWRTAHTALMLCLVATLAAQAPPQGARDPQPQQKAAESGTATIRGRIVRSDTGQPIRRVEVALYPQRFEQFSEVRTTVTDHNGRFEFTAVDNGRYDVKAVRGGYVEAWYGQRRPLEPRDTIEISKSQPVGDADITLVPAGAISGFVIDEEGEPLARVAVRALRIRFVNGVPVPQSIGIAANPTDDLGQFRVSGLPPGEYVVAAQADSFSERAADLELVPTYFPGTAAIADARRLRLGPGQDVPGITFAMLRARAASISGIVVDSSSKPVGSGRVGWSLKTLSGATGSSLPVGADGRFTIPMRAPGEYRLSADVNALDGRRRAIVDVTLTGEDITGIVLTPRSDVSLRGRVKLDDGSSPAGLRASDVQVLGNPTDDPRVNWISLRSEVDDDWTFNGTVPAGFRWVLRVTAPPGWATKSIRAGGRDITDAAFELGADLTDVEIVLTQRTTRVTGRVRSDRGSTAAFSTVVIAADDPQKWVPYTRFVQRTRADGAGRFTIRGLPAGRYVATAVDYLEEGEEHNPDRLARIRERGVPVILSEAESRSIDLIVTDAP